jgi:hypothetical protein
MTGLGYALLALLGYLGLKAFSAGGPKVPFTAGVAGTPIDPATGAKIINTAQSIMGPVQPQSRIPATDVGAGKMWCPYPFTLYKDLADGKFYCYNESAPQPTTTVNAIGQTPFVVPGTSTTVIGTTPAPEPVTMYSAPGVLTAPVQPIDQFVADANLIDPSTVASGNAPLPAPDSVVQTPVIQPTGDYILGNYLAF